jgi:protein-disulfide isomerase
MNRPTAPKRSGTATSTQGAPQASASGGPARLSARQAAAAKRKQRNRLFVIIGGGVIVAAAIVGIVVQANRSASNKTNVVIPSSANGPGGSVMQGSASAPVLVEMYGDFQCPHCAAWEASTYPTVQQLVQQGKIRFAFHNFPFIGNESFALANAAMCAGDEGKFWEAHDFFYANQQPENSGYWNESQLIAALDQVGAASPQAQQCVHNHPYYSWLHTQSDGASQRGVTGTPTVFVDGKVLNYEGPQALIQAVNNAAKG